MLAVRTLATLVDQASMVRRPSANRKKLVMVPSGAKASAPSTRSTLLSWSTTSNDMGRGLRQPAWGSEDHQPGGRPVDGGGATMAA